MAIIVNHNLSAMNANRMLQMNNSALSKSLEKLSSGMKINRAADDATGLSISEKMRAQIRGLDQANANSEDGVSLIQTADAALDTTEQMLQRIRELAVKGATGTLADDDVNAIQDEMQTLIEGINQGADRTEFNTKQLLNGDLKGEVNANYASAVAKTASNAMKHEITANGLAKYNDKQIASYVGAQLNGKTFTSEASMKSAEASLTQKITSSVDKSPTSSAATKAINAAKDRAVGQITGDAGLTVQSGANAGQTTTFSIADMHANKLSSALTVGITTETITDTSGALITEVDNAIQAVSKQRSKLGAKQNQLEYTVDNLSNTSENLSNAESRIRDTDMASEMMNYTKLNILTQSAQSMLSQANQKQQNVLSLLQ
ncbi:MAG: flagellin [bacterium]